MLRKPSIRTSLFAILAAVTLSTVVPSEAGAGDRGRYRDHHGYFSKPYFGFFFGYPSFQKRHYAYRPDYRHRYYSKRHFHGPNRYWKHKHRDRGYGRHRGHRGRH
ncbi:hypothetical protein [Ferruginivarius sediminum]|uniref:hypothetical protein n=1 Tax=Ferruginivarius sediminum TaxID=2661937 RepID=UPI0011C07E7B|nr:hypothetical protein [Ferruginivarius sediminum]